MDDANRNPQNGVIETADTVEAEAKPEKLLLGKRVLRAFNVRSGLRTGEGCSWCTNTEQGTRCGGTRP